MTPVLPAPMTLAPDGGGVYRWGIAARTADTTMALSRKVNFDTVRRIALEFPGVEEGVSYGTAAFRVRGKFLSRLREDGETLVVKCGFDERDFRMQADPQTAESDF